MSARSWILLAWCLAGAQLASAQKFSSPLFKSQDPYITYWKGNYYYSDSGSNRIRIRKSPTLTGLAKQTPYTVWIAPRAGPDGHANIWAPEIHEVDGRWYIYYAADYDSSGRHFLYALEGGSDPLDPYRAAETGVPEGKLPESTGHWAIDPNIFRASDGRLYLTWSCTSEDVGAASQALCISRMKDALHFDSATVRIASPTEPWETRTGRIEEGPIGFVHDGTNYITYSASASWTANDYAAGVLMNATGNLLDPKSWAKRGPIFDHHGKSYGPGSVVFVASPDGTELWSLYHAYERLDCPAWGCRSIGMQKVAWDADGCPKLGYPVDPGVLSGVPSGDGGSPTGWGNSLSGESASSGWVYNDSASVDLAGGGSFEQTFRGAGDLLAYTASASVQALNPVGSYGMYVLYQDAANHVDAFLTARPGAFVIRSVVAGIVASEALPLAANFDFTAMHTLRVDKSAARRFTFALDGLVMDTQTLALDFGQTGLFAEGAAALFRDVRATDASFGWGVAPDDGPQGLWEIPAGGAAISASLGAGWQALYQGSPNFASYTAGVDARLLRAGDTSPQPRFGLMACYGDRENYLTAWINPAEGALEFHSVIQGASSWQSVDLPVPFDAAQFHRLSVTKAAKVFTFSLDGAEVLRQAFNLRNGAAGVATEDALVEFQGFVLRH